METTLIRYIGPMEAVHIPEFSEDTAYEPFEVIAMRKPLAERMLLSADWEIVPEKTAPAKPAASARKAKK